jgi:hypothetical protein
MNDDDTTDKRTVGLSFTKIFNKNRILNKELSRRSPVIYTETCIELLD